MFSSFFIIFCFISSSKWFIALENCRFMKIEKKSSFMRFFGNFFDKITKGGMSLSKWAISCQFWERIVDFSLLLEKNTWRRTPCTNYIVECPLVSDLILIFSQSVRYHQKSTFTRIFLEIKKRACIVHTY